MKQRSLLLACLFTFLFALHATAGPKAAQLFGERFQVNGNVRAVAPLPNGQVIIGGDFATVNGVEQPYVARLNADGTLDSAWRPQFPIPVRRLTVVGDEVYLLGQPSFSDQANEKADPMVLRTTLSGDGQVDPSWSVTTQGLRVGEFDDFFDFAVSEGFVYLLYHRGDFTSEGRPDRLHLARYFRSGAGALDRSWTPKTLATRSPALILNTARVFVDAAHVYVAHETASARASRLERFAVTGRGAKDLRWSQDVRLATFRNQPIGGIADVAQDDNFLYLAGFGLNLRPGFAGLGRISKRTGRSDRTWPDAATATEFSPSSLTVSGSTAFFTAFGPTEPLIVAFPTAPGGRTFTETLGLSLPPRVTASNGAVFLELEGAESRLNQVLRLDAVTGAIDARFETRIFRPAVINQVLRTESGHTYVAGRFDAVGDLAIRNLVRFNPDGELDTAWTPNPGPLDQLFLTGDLAYGFTPGGISRFSLSAPGLRDANWNPGEKLGRPDDRFITAAEFTAEGAFVVHAVPSPSDVDRVRLRRIPLDGDGTPDPAWNVNLTPFGTVMKAHAGFLYVGSKSFGPVERFALDGGGVRDLAWKIDLGGGASITADDTFLYFTDLGGRPRRYALAGTGFPDPAWQPEFSVTQLAPDGTEQSPTIASLRKVGPWLYAGGFFDTVSGAEHLSVARIGADGLADPGFTTVVPFVVSIDDFAATQSGPRWVGAFGETPVLGGIFEEIDGVPASAPVIFNALTPPTLMRSGARVFASVEGGAALGVGFFRVTGLLRGSLATSAGAPLALGSFVSVADASAGLDFTPDPNSEGARSISLASATAAEAAATGSESATIDLTDTLPPRNRYRLANAQLTVREGSAAATITVEKIGAQAGAVTFAIEEGVARAGEHFTAAASTTLSFPAGDGSAVISVPLLDDALFAGNKDFRVVLTGTNDGGLILSPSAAVVTIEDDDPIGDTNSLTTRPALSDPPAASATLRADLNAPLGAWRLLGEAIWHASGETLAGLTRGNYFVEFRLANGFIAPPARTVPVDFEDDVVISGEYLALETAAVGALSVSIEPASVATADSAARGQWRLVGETAWRDSGAVAEDLPTGPYEVEFKPIASRQAPPVQTVNVAGSILYTVTGTYLIADTTPGAQPQPVDFADAKTAPLAFVGQVNTPLGFASGTAVRGRVVLTVAHALFDDVTLSAVTEARWYHQKARGDFEPPPQVARGWYIFEGYAGQRAADVTSGSGGVGISTPESQQLDVAAMWFLEPCARGSFAGYLRTDAGNDWLLAARRRILAGYPVEAVVEDRRGILHATDADTASAFTAPNAAVRATESLKGFGGMSGGPLLVENAGAFFPAGVFLGGTAQTLVRVIDAQVVDLINRGEASGNGGDNNVGGGITLVAPGITASPFAPTLLGCTLSPAGAVAGGAAWRIAGEEGFRASGVRIARNPGTYRLEFKAVPGFATPPSEVVNLVQGQVATARVRYLPGARIATTVSPAGAGTAPTGDFAIGQPATLIARPAPGFLFSAWLDEAGATISRSASLTLTVSGPRNLQAVFIPGSFNAYAGTYSGLHESGGVANGLANFTLTATGSFTGEISFGGERYRVRGSLNADGVFAGSLGRFALLLEIDRTSPVGMFTGEILDGGARTRFTATQSPFSRNVPTPLAGNYTLLLPAADPTDATRPPGSGFAAVNVSASGAVRFAGSLADGVAIGGGGALVADNAWPLYASIYQGRGALAGTLVFRAMPGVSDADGPVEWVRPPALRGGLFPGGFQTQLAAVASRYTAPAVDYSAATLRLTGGGLALDLNRPLAFSPRLVGTSSGDPSVRLAIQAQTGLFSGSVTNPATRRKLFVEGAIFQAARRAEGFFTGPQTAPGAAEFTPAP